MCYKKSFKFTNYPNTVKSRRSEIDELIDLLIKSFKKSKNLPYFIKTNHCPTKKKNCSRHHGETIVESYNEKTGKFHCVYYGVHVPKKIFEHEQMEDIVRSMIHKSLTKLYRGKKPMVSVRQLKKILYTDGKARRHIMHFRCRDNEKLIILAKAKKRGLNVSEYLKQSALLFQ